MSNINDTFFDGYYKDIWKAIIPEELTNRETDFLISYFKLQTGNSVLDLMCGYGRHALALGRKGIAVTAVDNLPAYISEIELFAQKEKLPVKTFQKGVLHFKCEEEMDLAICMGNSLNFFNATDVGTILGNTSKAIKAGGYLLINGWSLAEIVYKNFSSRTWSEINGIKFLTESRLVFFPARLESDSTTITAEGIMEQKAGVNYIYSLNEMENLLLAAGFKIEEVFSIPGKKKFALGDPRVYIVAKKM